MPDTDLQTSAANVIPSESNAISNEGNVIPSEANTSLSDGNVILSAAKDLSLLETPTDLNAVEPDLVLEDELVIEDFTIDGICGVY